MKVGNIIFPTTISVLVAIERALWNEKKKMSHETKIYSYTFEEGTESCPK